MIQSMTGFGKAGRIFSGKSVSAEIRSLNSKGMDINLRLPDLYQEKEYEIRKLLSGKLERGKADLVINIESSAGTDARRINKPVVKNYYARLKSIADELKAEHDDFLEIIMRLPNVLSAEKKQLRNSEWQQVFKLIESAANNLIVFRKREGKEIGKDLHKRLKLILNLLGKIEEKDKARIELKKEHLRKKAEESVSKEKIDNNRFEQELIYYLEKLDITEEKVRLKAHCNFFFATMNESSCGRKLAFISQEIGREINTLGSKANDAGIQKLVVQMKDELEKIKEQLNNVL